ncbi:MAG: SusC/RagA family TonB-linked outer membrane protein [Lutibacter sp.]|nr:MAG: SusC/RagA family TonB-linked outer membrane protein [Lutibacter sp.]
MKTKFNGILTLLLAFVVQLTFAQSKTISGTVSDGSDSLPGVSVIIKGTQTGTESDFDGNYSITANAGDVLQYSFVGMGTIEKTVGAANTINVTMTAEAESLAEVVISGFNRKIEKRSSTFAVQSLNNEDLSVAREANIANSLSGKISGVQVTASSGSVGASSRIILRGASSITGNNQPLYVVDGVPLDNTNYGNAGSGGGRDMPNGVADINPDDIEAINVLKGPAAAALYGVRASNGVIEITTKKGKQGTNLGISFNSNVQFDNPLILNDYQNSYGQGSNPYTFEWIDGTNGDGGVDESWGPPLDVGLEFVQWDSYRVGGAPLPWVSHPNNIKDFFATGVQLSNSISFSGGTEDLAYRLSMGKFDQTGMVPFTDYNRFTVGGSSSYTISDKFTTSLNLNYTKSGSDNLPYVGYDNENPVQQFIWSGRQVDFNALRDWRNLPLSPVGTAAEGTPLNWNTVFQNNPFWVLETNLRDFKKDRIVGNVGMNYEINEHFTLSGKVGLDHWNSIATQRRAFGSNNGPNGSYSETIRSYSERNAELLLGYTTDINEDFSFDLSVGGNQMKRDTKLNFLSAPQLQLPGLYNTNNLRAGSTYVAVNTSNERRINSVYGFGKLSYKNYLFLEFTGRNDWLSVLPVDNNNFFYPSVTASAVVTDMLGTESDILSFLKLRGGWAEVGGGPLAPYSLQPTYGLSTTPFGTTTVGFLPNTLNNPNIKPETTTGTEFGIDVRFFDSRLRINATYYDQTTVDAIIAAQVSAASGYTSTFRNIGETNNKGYEIQLGATVVDKGDFKFDVDLNFAANENTVVSLGGLESLVLGGQWSMTLEAREGMPYGVIVGSSFRRAPDGQIIYEDGLPAIDGGQKVLGDIAPDWTGGANFTFKYKNFTLGALIDAKIGGDIHSMTTSWGRYAGVLEETLIGRETGIVGDGVMVDPLTGAFVPNNVVRTAEDYNKRAYSNSIVESAVFDASYVKLRQVTFGYKLPSQLIEKTMFKDINVSLVGRNLAILYKNLPHIDPETAFSDGNGEQGQEFGQLPSARSIGLNISLKL